MPGHLIDGKLIAETVRREVAAGVAAFREKSGRAPGLHVILAGEDPASAVYVRNKEKAAKEVGMAGEVHRLPASVGRDELLDRIRVLREDRGVDGILVQLPLPKGLSENEILDAVPADKDVDGFHPMNAGLLATGRAGGMVPCTPFGSMRLIDEAIKLLPAPFSLAGAHAVVVGRSNIVGKPMAQLLLARHATVTIAHSRTRDLAAVCREADVLVVAVGKANLVGKEHVKPGAIVIDVGMNRLDIDGKSKLVGDVDFAAVRDVAGAITPVPGGVGPMTIAMLLANTLRAAERHG